MERSDESKSKLELRDILAAWDNGLVTDSTDAWVLLNIVRLSWRDGYATPSIAYLQAKCRIKSARTVQASIKRLEAAGLIERVPQPYAPSTYFPTPLAIGRTPAEIAGGTAKIAGGGIRKNCGEREKGVEERRRREKTPPSPQGEESGRFVRFWAAYPKRVAKPAAMRAFAKLESRPDIDALLATILTALAAQKRSQAWTKDGGQFIPNPATYLNQERWADEEASPGRAASTHRAPWWDLAGFQTYRQATEAGLTEANWQERTKGSGRPARDRGATARNPA